VANSQDFVDFVLEQMSLFGPVSAKRMFGGHGLYIDGLMFALIDDDRLYLKADAETQPHFAAKSLPPFTYGRKGESAVSLGYFEAPPEVFDDKTEMSEWARLAQAAALRAKAKPKKKRPPQPR
jgi:DNA transformation protein